MFGYYIEITNAHAARIPADYQRKQTLKNAERYITPELKEQEEKVLTAQEKINQREYELFAALRERVAAQTHRLLQTAEVLAALDVLAGLAELAAERSYCRPELADEPIAGDRATGGIRCWTRRCRRARSCPTTSRMGPEQGTVLLITGPNMGGKARFIRQVALLTLMAQMGSFVPARQARIGLADRIFTRVGASDDLGRAQSTFMVEMTEAANILNNATPRSLVILDEIGRGTSTYDGVSLAWGITEYLHDTDRLPDAVRHALPRAGASWRSGWRTCGTTTCWCTRRPTASSSCTRSRRAARTRATASTWPSGRACRTAVLERARAVLAELEAHHLQTPARPADHIARPRLVQASLFAGTEDPVLQALRGFEIDGLTPEEVVEQVRRWQRELSEQ